MQQTTGKLFARREMETIHGSAGCENKVQQRLCTETDGEHAYI